MQVIFDAYPAREGNTSRSLIKKKSAAKQRKLAWTLIKGHWYVFCKFLLNPEHSAKEYLVTRPSLWKKSTKLSYVVANAYNKSLVYMLFAHADCVIHHIEDAEYGDSVVVFNLPDLQPGAKVGSLLKLTFRHSFDAIYYGEQRDYIGYGWGAVTNVIANFASQERIWVKVHRAMQDLGHGYNVNPRSQWERTFVWNPQYQVHVDALVAAAAAAARVK